LTIVCTVLLQGTGFAVSWADVKEGFSFNLPIPMTTVVLLTALAMYAGTGVAYGEMAAYTYWCVEKGYARNTGVVEPGEAWTKRARGWIRVMYTDALLTMVVYTLSTVCFFILGAAVLHAKGLNPDGLSTISILSQTFTESLGSWSATLFIVGAFFVLFSTVLARVAGVSRMLTDTLGVMGIRRFDDYKSRLRFIRIFVIVALVMYSIAYWLFENPPQMLIITSSILAAVFYPTLGLGVLYLRHRKVDRRVTPNRLTTILLWICGITLTVISPGGIILTFLINYNVISFGH
jgi:manganese transport protein